LFFGFPFCSLDIFLGGVLRKSVIVYFLKVWMAAPEEKHRFVQENSMLMAYPYKTVHRDKMKSPVNQKCCFHLFVLAVKTCSIEANTTLALEDGTTGQN